jgi:hypothetical protein
MATDQTWDKSASKPNKRNYMQKTFSITNVGSHRISFCIGEDAGGYSCVRVPGIQHGYISTGRSVQPGTEIKVWCFEYEPMPWHGVVTDQDLINKLVKQDKGDWMPTLIKSALQIAAEADQLLHLIQKTVEIAEKAAYLKGRTDQAQTIVKSLGLEQYLARF